MKKWLAGSTAQELPSTAPSVVKTQGSHPYSTPFLRSCLPHPQPIPHHLNVILDEILRRLLKPVRLAPLIVGNHCFCNLMRLGSQLGHRRRLPEGSLQHGTDREKAIRGLPLDVDDGKVWSDLNSHVDVVRADESTFKQVPEQRGGSIVQ